MKQFRENLHAVALAAGSGLAIVGAIGIVAERRLIAAVTVTGLMIIFLALALHLHQRMSDGLREVRRSNRQGARLREEASQQFEDLRAGFRSDLVAEVAEAIERDLALANGRVTARVDALEATIRHVSRELRHDAGRIGEQTRRLSDELEQSNHVLKSRLGEDWNDLRSELETVRGTTTELLDSVRRLRYEPVTEIDALLQIHRRFPLDGSVPLIWGWALSPRALLQVLDIALEPEVRTIVECGSGTSTIYLGAAMRHRPGARVVAIEHLDEIADAVEAAVRGHGLEDVVEIRRADLTEMSVDDERYQWYDTRTIDDLSDVDVLLVDGPPGSTGPLARLPAVPYFRTRLADGAMVALDDARRPDELAVLKRWKGHEPRLQDVRSITQNLALLRLQNSKLDA